MQAMSLINAAAALVASIGVSGPPAAMAQAKPDDHAGHHAASTATVPALELATGEVRRIAKDTNKITLRHGEIKSLDMPPMTMVFVVRDSSMLDALKVGDKIRFAAEKSADGTYAVTRIEPER